MSWVTYNGYTFNEYSHATVSASMVEDEAGRTILYHRYTLRVTSTIYAEDSETNAGEHFLRVRRKLTKQGAKLTLEFEGFGPKLDVNDYGVSDVAFGPKPRMLSWSPIGATNAVEIVWECEFCIPTCDGEGVRFTGLSALNYSISVRINKSGYTTRQVSGYLEIAMTRVNRSIPDTADAYRNRIILFRPIDFERETTWNLSADKRRADFSITDSQIESPNAYPPGVIDIKANHRVGWSRRQLATLPNSISATITLAPTMPRSHAWEMFRAIVRTRIPADIGDRQTIFLDTLDVNEELYGHIFSFSLTYRILFHPGHSALSSMFTSTNIGKSVSVDWASWSASVDALQSHTGMANLVHIPAQDQIVDLCAPEFQGDVPLYYLAPNAGESEYYRFCNAQPPPDRSYLRFEPQLNAIEESPATSQIKVGPDDRLPMAFDKFDSQASLGQSTGESRRYVESITPGVEFEWSGYAERVGYPIPRPEKLTISGVELVRKGPSEFRQKFLGTHFCQPVYGAAWRTRYVAIERPEVIQEIHMNTVEEFGPPGLEG